MRKTHAFATIRRARSLRERHPDAPLSVIAIAQNLATYANGRTGTNIRPGHARVAAETGLSERTVREGIRWLIEREELRRDKPGHRGSAACYTFLGVSPNGGGMEPPFDGKAAAGRRNGGGSTPPTNPTSQTSGSFQDPSASDGWHVEREAGEDSAPAHRSSPSGIAGNQQETAVNAEELQRSRQARVKGKPPRCPDHTDEELWLQEDRPPDSAYVAKILNPDGSCWNCRLCTLEDWDARTAKRVAAASDA